MLGLVPRHQPTMGNSSLENTLTRSLATHTHEPLLDKGLTQPITRRLPYSEEAQTPQLRQIDEPSAQLLCFI